MKTRLLTQNTRIITGLFVVIAFLMFLGTAVQVGAQNFQRVCTGVAYTGDNCDQPGNAQAQSSINNLIEDGLEIFSVIVGVVGVAMIIYGGYKYITAGGDSSKINSAQQTIIYALIGLVVAALAQIIARFVLATST